jgi:hypothetical protein
MDLTSPTFIHVYLPNGEVDVLTGCTWVRVEDGVLQFVDRMGQVSRTNLPFLMTWDKEASRATPAVNIPLDIKHISDGEPRY